MQLLIRIRASRWNNAASGASSALRFPVLALAVALAPVPAVAGSAAELDDAAILGIYAQVNSFDIETALLGRAQAHAPGVRELALQVSTDHQGVRSAAYDLAGKCKVIPTLPEGRDAAAREHGAVMARLSALKGVEFDKAYLRHEVAFHSAAVGAVRSALQPSATCPALREHFAAVLPHFEHHLAQTQALARKYGAI